MDNPSPDATDVQTQTPSRYAEYQFVPEKQRTRNEIVALGAQMFAAGAFIAVLIYVTAKIIVDFRHFNSIVAFKFAYCAVPVAAAVGAVVGYRVYRQVLSRGRRSTSSILLIFLLLFAILLLLGLIMIPIYFAYFMRRGVLEDDRRNLFPAFIYFLLALVISVATAYSSYIAGLSSSIISMCLCCDVLLINVLQSLRTRNKLAPLATQKFQFSLGTLFCVIFAMAAWVSGLVVMFRK